MQTVGRYTNTILIPRLALYPRIWKPEDYICSLSLWQGSGLGSAIERQEVKEAIITPAAVVRHVFDRWQIGSFAASPRILLRKSPILVWQVPEMIHGDCP